MLATPTNPAPVLTPPPVLVRSGVWPLVAGLITTLAVSLIFSLSITHARFAVKHPLLRSLAFIAVTVAAATLASWIIWHIPQRSRFYPAGNFFLRSAILWTLLAPLFPLQRRESPWLLLLVGLAAVATISILRNLSAVFGSIESSTPPAVEAQLFSTTFGPKSSTKSSMGYAFLAAVCIELTAVALVSSFLFLASLCVALAIFAPAWRWLPSSSAPIRKDTARVYLQLACAVILVILLTWNKQMPILSGNKGAAGSASAGHAHPAQNKQVDKQKENVRADSGYKGIILWLQPQKKTKIVPPTPRSILAATTNAHKPLIIPFDGAYWYFQPPHNSPGLHPHIDHGDPTRTNIRSTNSLPLLMEAHQSLGSSIDLACCRELQLTVANNDNRPGSIVLGVVLTDSTAHGKPSQSLGGKVVVSSQPSNFIIKSSPLEETLHYSIPAHATIQKFDQITVIFSPSFERFDLDVKLALKQFALLPK